MNTLGLNHNEQKDAKETAHYKWVLIVTELFTIAVNDFDAKKYVRSGQVLCVYHARFGASLSKISDAIGHYTATLYMYNSRKVCKMWYPHNLVLENLKYLLFYLTFWVVISNGGLKLPKLSIHSLAMFQK